MQISPKEELISSTISSLSNHHLPIAPYTKLGFTSLHTVNKNKPYIPYSDCVLKHILHSLDLTNQEKLFYLIADSLSLISGQNATKKRAAALPATKWAKNLNCSKNEIFTMQKSLEAKGYFIVVRDKNEFGKNQRNIITPSLPDTVFHYLSKALNRSNNELTDNSPITSLTSSLAFSHCLNIEKNKIEENKRVYLDKTKLFIRLNYQLLLLITSSDQLTSFAKVLWLDFYTKCYKYHMKLKNTDTGNDNNNFACTTSYKELETKYSCTKATLSKTMNVLEKLGFIDKKRFHVKNDNKDDNLHDKSLWSVTLSLPKELALNILNLKPRLEYAYQANSKPNISSTDPYVANFGQLLNKDLKSNNKDSDSIDSEKIFSEKTNISSPKNLSELSVSYKNSLEKKTKEILLEKEQKIVSNKTNLPNIQESILKTETSNNLEEGKLKAIEEISETVREEQEKTLLLNQVNEQNNEQEQINTTNGLINTMAEMPVTSTTNLPNNSSSYNKSLSYNKQSTQDKSLKSFYPLTKEQVDKLNQLSNREFSNNFANQLLLKLYIRDPNKTFASTNHMISYMSKAFRYEKHQAPMVNHETFRFTANVSDPESVEMRQKEKYLTEVEYSMDTSYSSQLRKKIAGIFETKLAYQILTEGKFDYHATNEQNTSQESEITNNAWQNLELSEENNITQFEYVLDHSPCFVDSSLSLDSKHDIADINYDTQLSTNVTEENDQMKSGVVMTENDDINDKILTRELSELPLKSSLPARQFTRITLANTCTVKLPKYLILTNHQQQNLEKAISTVYGYVKIVYQQLPATYKKLGQSRLPDEIFLTELDQNSVWYKIRKKLIDNFDEHIDKAWFSKLRAEEDVITQKLTLIAPTNFLRDWINAKYSSFIKDIAKKLDYQFVELITKIGVSHLAKNMLI